MPETIEQRVVILDSGELLRPGIELLRGRGVTVDTVPDGSDPAVTAAALDGAPVAIVGVRPVDAAQIAGLRGTGLLIRAGIGYDIIDVDAATKAGVWVANVPDYCVDEVADHATLLLMSAWRRVGEMQAIWRAGKWIDPSRIPPVHRIRGRRLGIVGFGRIGRAVAQRAAAFGWGIAVYDPIVVAEDIKAVGATPVTLDELFATSDAVTLHSPLTPETQHLVDAARLATVQPGFVLVNTSRGGLVDLDAVDAALRVRPARRGRAGRGRGRADARSRPSALPATQRDPDAAPRLVLARGAGRSRAVRGRGGLPLPVRRATEAPHQPRRAAGARVSGTSGRSILRDVRLIDGIAATAREHVDVVIDAGRIAALDDHRPDRVIEPGDVVWPGAGATVLPGFIDCHAHYTIDARLEVPDGIIDALPGRSGDRGLHRRPERGDGPALRCHDGAQRVARRTAGTWRCATRSRRDTCRDRACSAAGGAITITGGHGWQFGHEADGVDELVKLTRSLARDGVDHFKIVASEAAQITTAVAGVEELTLEEVTAIVAEARRLRRRVMSHAQSSGAVITSARGGVDSVEHAFLADREALETLAECGTTLVPTLTVTDVYRDIPGVSEAVQARQRELTVQHRTSCETAIGLGIPMATGTDCGVRGVMPDMLWREIYNLYDHGLSPMDAIKAGTSGAARLLGLEAEAGTVAVGRAADLVRGRGRSAGGPAAARDAEPGAPGWSRGPRGRPGLRPGRGSRRAPARGVRQTEGVASSGRPRARCTPSHAQPAQNSSTPRKAVWASPPRRRRPGSFRGAGRPAGCPRRSRRAHSASAAVGDRRTRPSRTARRRHGTAADPVRAARRHRRPRPGRGCRHLSRSRGRRRGRPGAGHGRHESRAR